MPVQKLNWMQLEKEVAGALHVHGEHVMEVRKQYDEDGSILDKLIESSRKEATRKVIFEHGAIKMYYRRG
jgi:dihydroorotase